MPLAGRDSPTSTHRPRVLIVRSATETEVHEFPIECPHYSAKS